jgi:hypothetical protein
VARWQTDLKIILMKKIFFLLVVMLSLSSCEKDDVCTEDTTPRLIVEFYDISNPGTLKNVVSLKVTGDGSYNNLDLGTYNGVSKIKLPLNPSTTSTVYHFILNSASTSSSPNEDIVVFNYTANTAYVSRACGFRTIYELNNPYGVVYTDATTPDTVWIQNLTVETTSITTENETHSKIYF